MTKCTQKSEYGKLMRLIQSKKVYWLGIIGTSIIAASFQIIIAWILKLTLNAAEMRNISYIIQAMSIFLVSIMVSSTLQAIFSYIYKKSTAKTIMAIKKRVFEKVEHLSIQYFETHHSGVIMSIFTNDIVTLETVYGQYIYDVIYTVIYGVSAAVAMLFIEWRLTIILIGLSTLSTIINTKFSAPIRKISNHIQKKQEKLIEKLTDVIDNILLIKMFNLKKQTEMVYEEENNALMKLYKSQGLYRGFLESTNCFLSLLGSFGIKVLGAFFVLKGAIDFGAIVAIVQLLNGVKTMFIGIGNFIVQIQGSFAGMERIYNLLDAEEETEYYNITEQLKSNEMIAFENVEFSYSKAQTTLEALSLYISKGSKVALVGMSGSGKSTILKLLMGFYPIDRGSIYVDGKIIGQYKLEVLRKMISYVPQETYLFNGTIEENIRYGNLNASLEQVIEAAQLAYAHEFIVKQKDGYQTKIKENGANFSGGQKQRIAIARAFLKNAPILLLDEPTSSLDTESEKMIYQALEILMRNRTTIMVAHRLTTIQQFDQIFYVDKGHIVEEGTHNELIQKNGSYKKLYELGIKTI